MRLSPLNEGHKLSRYVWVDYTIRQDGLTSQPGTATYSSIPDRWLTRRDDFDYDTMTSQTHMVRKQYYT
jgi:hypothetical protein